MDSGLDPVAVGMTMRELADKIKEYRDMQASSYNELRQKMIERYQEVLQWKSETGSR